MQLSALCWLKNGVTARGLPDAIGTLTRTDSGVRLEVRAESLDWIGRVLAGLGCRLTIEQPAELRLTIASLARSLQGSAEAKGPPAVLSLTRTE